MTVVLTDLCQFRKLKACMAGKLVAGSQDGMWSDRGLTQIDGHMKRCRPALEGLSNSNLMDPLALHSHASPQGWNSRAV